MNSSKICRLCLREAHLPHSLIEFEGAHLMENLLSIEIDKTDSLPKFACISCWLNLKLAHKIIENFLESNKKLEALLFCSDNLFDRDEADSIPEQMLPNVEYETDIDHGCQITESPTNNYKIVDLNKICENINQAESGPNIVIEGIENLTDSEFSILIVNDKALHNVNCRICGDCIPVSEEMNHVREHFEIINHCWICEFECQNMSSLRKHLKENHHHDMKEVYTCVNCFASFQYIALYKLHIEKAHLNDEEDDETVKYNYMTKKLGMKLGSKGWKILTDSAKEHKCDICSKLFSNSMKLSCHKRDCHVLRQCPKCGKFISASNIQMHVRSHDAQTVSCDLCEKTFKNKESLRSHKKSTHSSMKHPCEYCDKVFKLPYSRTLHVRKVHTGEKSVLCEDCGKEFFTRFKLKQHINNTHLKNWKYKCSHCEKLCSTRWNLKAHERQHKNEWPYDCGQCGEAFKQMISLKNHIRSKHQEETTQS